MAQVFTGNRLPTGSSLVQTTTVGSASRRLLMAGAGVTVTGLTVLSAGGGAAAVGAEAEGAA